MARRSISGVSAAHPTSTEPRAEPAPWAEVKALFDALQPQAPAERQAALAAAAPALRAEVQALLEAEADTPADFLSPVAEAIWPAPEAAARGGQRVGPWRLVSLLGRGGMGEVWLAERDDGAWRGEAAVKLLQRGMDSQAVLARFALERQALARLAHPHIARLLDAGVSGDGMPYFVMERVRGQPIDRACEGRPLAERLGLFLQLADAVAHAHGKLLLHRDLKPSNVLVDEAGDVKLLDFGIAKALAGSPSDTGTHPGGLGSLGSLGGLGMAVDATQIGPRAFSPHYASPEHLRGEPVGVASDVFSLGVLLSEMLTGRRPHGDEAASALVAARAVLDVPPRPPSALFEAHRPAARGLARAELLGDIDAVVLRALDKAAERRYASVEALAADLRAHLAGYPVSARAPQWWDLAARFARRNRWAVAAGALGVLGLAGGLASAVLRAQAALALGLVASAGGLVVALVMLRRATEARELAAAREAELRQLVRSLVFGHHDRIAMLPGSTEARERLLADAVRFLGRLVAPGAPVPEPALAREVAEAYLRIAVLQGESFSPSQERLAEAEAHLERALALQPLYLGAVVVPQDALNAAADMWFARTAQLSRRGRLAPALAALEHGRALAQRAHEAAPDDLQARSRLATAEGRVGMLLGNHVMTASLGRIDAAGEPLARSAAAMRALCEADPADAEWQHQAAWAEQNLALWHLLRAEAAPALAHAHAAVRLRDEACPRAPANAHYRHQRASVRSTLAAALALVGDDGEAEATMAEAQAIAHATAAADPANRSAQRDRVMFDLAMARLLAAHLLQAERPPDGDGARARQLLEDVLARWPDAPDTAGEDFYLARWRAETRLWLARLQPAAEAARALELAREARALMAGDDDNASRRWALAMALGEEAAAFAALGDAVQARERAALALAQWRSVPGGAAPLLLRPWQQRVASLAG
jgi:eukaryotic-like serine/threonine-protein kinase